MIKHQRDALKYREKYKSGYLVGQIQVSGLVQSDLIRSEFDPDRSGLIRSDPVRFGPVSTLIPGEALPEWCKCPLFLGSGFNNMAMNVFADGDNLSGISYSLAAILA